MGNTQPANPYVRTAWWIIAGGLLLLAGISFLANTPALGVGALIGAVASGVPALLAPKHENAPQRRAERARRAREKAQQRRRTGNPYLTFLGWLAVGVFTLGLLLNMSDAFDDDPYPHDPITSGAPLMWAGLALGLTWLVVKAITHQQNRDQRPPA